MRGQKFHRGVYRLGLNFDDRKYEPALHTLKCNDRVLVSWGIQKNIFIPAFVIAKNEARGLYRIKPDNASKNWTKGIKAWHYSSKVFKYEQMTHHKVEKLEKAVYNDDNLLMKSGFVVADSPTPHISNSAPMSPAGDIAKMEWSDIHELVKKAGGQ